MDTVFDSLIRGLPKPDIVLNDKTKKKIHRLIPVPNDFEILWADILSYGGYPSGIVITKQALIIKATKDDVKKKNKQIKKANKGLKKADRNNLLRVIYQIIPWEYYSPEEYKFTVAKDNNGKRKYIISSKKEELIEFSSSSLYNFLISFNTVILEEQKKAEEIMENSTFSSVNSINAEGTMFNATYGADQTKTGHGIYAEEAGAILDIFSGEKSTVVGRDNAKNGPDKIVNSVPIQCKYCKTAYSSVNSCFKKNIHGVKTFRYLDLNNNPMKIEVPSDQYMQAIDYMKKRISNGQVPGLTDPNAAYDIIRKGKLSYNQALNLAKAGTVESITFDAATGAVTCLSALGISSLVTFAQVFWETKDYKAAAKYAITVGMQVYGLSFAGGIISSQLSRTGIANVFKPLATSIANNANPKMIQEIVNGLRALAGKKAIYGAAAQKSFIKFLGSNAITEGALLFVFSIPDIYRLCSRKISGAQYTKNMLSLVGSFVGSISFTVGAGAIIGRKFGANINKNMGSAIGYIAGAGGGLLVGTGVKVVGNFIHEDDSVITTRMFNAIMINLLIDYMLSDQEQNQLITFLDNDKKNLKKLQQSLIMSSSQANDIEQYLRPIFESIVKQRSKITVQEEHNLHENMKNIILDGGLTYEM